MSKVKYLINVYTYTIERIKNIVTQCQTTRLEGRKKEYSQPILTLYLFLDDDDDHTYYFQGLE